jgi:stringent starvation protein B
MDNDSIRFHARFGGVSREIFIPVNNVMAIYANENGQGMAFEPQLGQQSAPEPEPEEAPAAPVLSPCRQPRRRQKRSAKRAATTPTRRKRAAALR